MQKSKPFISLFTSAILSFTLISLLRCNGTQKSTKPQIFDPDNISTKMVEYASSFSSSGSEVYFARSAGDWGTTTLKSSIYYAVKNNDVWSTPKLVSFSGQYDDSAPHITNDGKTLYFISKRPSKGVTQISQDIWKVEKDKNGGWGTPTRLHDPINSSVNEYGICTDEKGNLYFASDRMGGYGQGDLYIAKKKDNGHHSPVNLGSTINSSKGEWNAAVNKNGTVLIYEASQRAQNLSSYGDLYISFKQNNQWSLPKNIMEINTTGSDLYAELNEGEDLLYFSSSDSLKSKKTNIYYIDFRPLEEKYRTNAVFQE